MLYQFDRPFAMDSAASEAALGLDSKLRIGATELEWEYDPWEAER